MHRNLAVVLGVLSGLVACCLAVSFSSLSGSKTLRVPLSSAKSGPRAERFSSAAELVATYEAAKLRVKSQTNKAALSDFPEPVTNGGGSEFYGTIMIGTPPQPFKVFFDTSDVIFFVPSSKCVKGPCFHHERYNSSASSTYNKNGSLFDWYNYFGKAANGFYSFDDVQIAGATIKKQIFGEAMIMSRTFKDAKYDGVLGLSYRYADDQQITPFESMINQNLVDSQVFSLYLGDNQNGSADGELMFGGINESHVKGNLNYVDIQNGDKCWCLNAQSVTVNNVDPLDKRYPVQSQFDSRCPFIMIQDNHADQLMVALGAKNATAPDFPDGMYEFDCDKLDQIPDAVITIQGVKLPLSASEIVMKVKDSTGKVRCISEIVATEWMGWFLGEPFMRAYYTVYDFGNRRMGFSRQLA